jgi:hypothetical protein
MPRKSSLPAAAVVAAFVLILFSNVAHLHQLAPVKFSRTSDGRYVHAVDFHTHRVLAGVYVWPYIHHQKGRRARNK